MAGVLSTSLPRSRRHPAPDALLALLLALAVAGAAGVGAVPVRLTDWLAPFSDAEMTGGAHVLWQLRLPRVLLAATVGASLGLAGMLAQALFRNPMADPGLLGIGSGAASAVALALTVFASLHSPLPPALRMWVLPAAAFAGALGVCLGLDRLARWLAPGSIAALLLTGLAVNAATMAVVGLCSFIATDEQLRSLNFWTLGSLAGADWQVLGVLAGALALAWTGARQLADGLNALALGEAVAGHVGINVARLRRRVVLALALVSALAVAWCGGIGFVGLMAPHIARLAGGADQRRVLRLAPPIGALLLVLADTAARTVAAPAEIPVGIFTALIGAPFFLLMLRSVTRRDGAVA